MTSESPVQARLERDGALLRLSLARPKANLVDAAMIKALHGALIEHQKTTTLRAVLLDAQGSHFSFGASVEEHLPDQCAKMLGSLHALIVAMVEFPAPILVAVRGQCLGGGLEVALAGGPIFAAPTAQFGQPEIKLGVFAPAASVLLPYRVTQPMAESLLLTGRSISAAEAAASGLVQVLAEDPEAAALEWFEQHLEGRSASALACAVAAARGQMLRDVRKRLAEVEQLYLERLMRTHDANEGLTAFLAKRQPAWTHK
jgi:cyclohexa-1,5-dienecarbonyl-CoA hydratase